MIPTEPIGSIPRPPRLIQAIADYQAHKIAREVMDKQYSEALRDTVDRLQKTGSPVLTDGEQTKPSFATYPLTGLQNLAPDGVVIPFADGHQRQLPRLTRVARSATAFTQIPTSRPSALTPNAQSSRRLSRPPR